MIFIKIILIVFSILLFSLAILQIDRIGKEIKNEEIFDENMIKRFRANYLKVIILVLLGCLLQLINQLI
jgi:uncharacterized membrane protein YidH (DUF202 family)